MSEKAWLPVINPSGRGYYPGFDENKLLEFNRLGSEEVSRFRMADTSPYFNVAGLFWREIPEERPACDWTQLEAYR